MKGNTILAVVGTAAASFAGVAVATVTDPARLELALQRFGADAALGLRALEWELATRVAGLEMPQIDRLDVGPAPLALAASLVALLFLLTRLRARRDDDRGRLPAVRLPSLRRRQTHGRRRPADRRVARARSLAEQGRPAVDVARETALSRDAVELLVRVRPDAFSGAGRSFRTGGRTHARA